MLKEASNDVINFKEYVNDQLNTLATRGETGTDIIINFLLDTFPVLIENSLSILKNVKMSMKKAQI
jgi:hypothetical protein